MKSQKTLWIVMGLVGALVFSGGAAVYLLVSRPAEMPASTDSSVSQPAEDESSSEPIESEPEEPEEPNPDDDDGTGEESTPVVSEPEPETPVTPPVVSSVPSPSSVYVPPVTSTPSTTTTGTSNLVISKTGTNDTTEACRNLYIETTPVVVKNKTVKGDLIVQATAGNGDVTLENVKVTGNIFVSGGGKVNLKNVTAQGMVADKATGTQTYALSGETSIPNFWTKANVTLDETGLSSGYTGVDNIYSQEGSPASNTIGLKGARLNNLSTSTTTDVSIPEDSSISKITAGSETHLLGNGTVRELEVNSNDVTYETKPIKVTENGTYSASSGGGSSGSGSSGSSSSSSKGTKLAKPTDLQVYMLSENGEDTIYCSFTGDKGAKSGYVITPYIAGKAQPTVELSSAGSGTPPKIEDIAIINNGTSIKNQQVHFAVYAKEDEEKGKYARSDTATSAKETVYLTDGFAADDLTITRSTASNPVYTIGWDEVDFDRTSNPKAPGNTTYTVSYTIRRADGSVAYQANDRTSTNRYSYKIPNVPGDLGQGASIDVTVKAKVRVDPDLSGSYPCTIQSVLSISNSFQLGKLPAPTGLMAELPKSGYGLTAKWAEVEGAENYTVTALIGYGNGAPQEVSQTVSGTEYAFKDLVTAGAADNVKTLGFKVVANAPRNSIYDTSEPATLGSAFNVPIKLSAPAANSMSIELLSEMGGTQFNAIWGTVANADQYTVFATHYFKSGRVDTDMSKSTVNAGDGTTQSKRFSDAVPIEDRQEPTKDYVQRLTFTAQTIAKENSWFRDSDPQESGPFSAAIYLDPPKVAEMTLALSKTDKDYFTAGWSPVDHAVGYLILPIYNGQPYTMHTDDITGRNNTSYKFEGLSKSDYNPQNIKSISFRVYALAEENSWYSNSDLSDAPVVQVNQPMPTPTNVSIEMADGNRKAIIRWNTVTDAGGYNLTYYLGNTPPPSNPDEVTEFVKYAGTARTEFTIDKIDPDIIHNLTVKVQTVPKSDSWNDNSDYSAEVSKDIAAHQCVTPISPAFTQNGNTLTVTWKPGVGHTGNDQYRVWYDLAEDEEPTITNAFYTGEAATVAFQSTGSASGATIRHVIIQAIPKLLEYNSEPSPYLHFYMLDTGLLTFDATGVTLPKLVEGHALSGGSASSMATYIYVSQTEQNHRGFSDVAYDGTADIVVPLNAKYTAWKDLMGDFHLELKSGDVVYHTPTVKKPKIA